MLDPVNGGRPHNRNVDVEVAPALVPVPGKRHLVAIGGQRRHHFVPGQNRYWKNADRWELHRAAPEHRRRGGAGIATATDAATRPRCHRRTIGAGARLCESDCSASSRSSFLTSSIVWLRRSGSRRRQRRITNSRSRGIDGVDLRRWRQPRLEHRSDDLSGRLARERRCAGRSSRRASRRS